MESLIIDSLVIFFFFFFINYSKLGAAIRNFIDFEVSMAKTGNYESESMGKIVEYASYPLRQCSFCFGFWAFLTHYLLNGIEFSSVLAGAVIVLFIDLLFKELAGLKR